MLQTGIESAYYFEDGQINYTKMAAHGYTCADFQGLTNTGGELYTCDDATFKARLTAEYERARAAGISFYQLHGPWPVDDATAELRAFNLACMKRCAEGAALLHCPYMVVHPVLPSHWDKETDPAFAMQVNRAYFTELCRHAQAFGVNICIENMPSINPALSTVAQVVAFVKEVNMPNFFICLDTGHANCTREGIGDAVRACGDLLKVLHIHDNRGSEDSHLVPYTWGGNIKWDEFKPALQDIGFTGCLSMETGIKPNCPTQALELMQRGVAQIAKSFDPTT